MSYLFVSTMWVYPSMMLWSDRSGMLDQRHVGRGRAAQHLLHVEAGLERAGAVLDAATVDQHRRHGRRRLAGDRGELLVVERRRDIAREDQVGHQHGHADVVAVGVRAVRRVVVGLLQVVEPVGAGGAVAVVDAGRRHQAESAGVDVVLRQRFETDDAQPDRGQFAGELQRSLSPEPRMAALADLEQRRAECLRDRGRGAAHAHAMSVGGDDGQAARDERVLHGGDVLGPGPELLHEVVRLQPLVVLRGFLVVLLGDQRLELGRVAQRQVDAELDHVLRGRGGDRGLRLGGVHRRQRGGLTGEGSGGAERGDRDPVDSHVIPLVVRNKLLQP